MEKQNQISKKDYAMVYQLAYSFAYGNKSIEYDEYVSAGFDGLKKAIDKYEDDKGTAFSTFAFKCAKDAMCTKQKKIKRFDLTQDDNVEVETLDSLTYSMVEENMANTVKRVVLRANKGNERNAEMFLKNIGFGDEEKMDYKELSAVFSVSAERVRQVVVSTRRAILSNPKDMDLLLSYVG